MNRPAAIRLNVKDDLEFVWIPPSAGMVGFFMSRYPVTNRQFREFMADSGYASADDEQGRLVEHWGSKRPPVDLANHPVVFVSLADANAYCDWANLALPTERMWERAAVGTDGRAFPWGDAWPYIESKETQRLCNVATDATTPVDAYSHVRSAYGCADMVGNVGEWCWEEMADEQQSAPQLKSTACVRGSSFWRKSYDCISTTHRRLLSPHRRNDWVGFRPALLVK